MIQYPDHIRTKAQRALYDSFPAFLAMVWEFLEHPTPTTTQLDIAHWLAHGPRRRIVEGFRGVGKSYVSAAYTAWLLYRNPDHKIMVVSASKQKADDFVSFTKSLVAGIPELSFLKPKGDQRDSTVQFDVGPAKPAQSPSVRALGIGGQLTGGRANTIVADDVEGGNNTSTENERHKLNQQVKEFDSILSPKGEIVYLGTPHAEDSLYGVGKLQNRGFTARIWPARFTEGLNKHGGDIYNNRLAPVVSQPLAEHPALLDKTVEPSRFTDEDLAEREASKGKSDFALQFQLNTSLSDADKHPLKINDLIIFETDLETAPIRLTWAGSQEREITGLRNVGLSGDRYVSPMRVPDESLPYQGSVLHIDPSGKGEDQTAYCVTKMLNGFIYVRQWGALEGGYDEDVLVQLCKIAMQEQVNEIQIEDNLGSGMFTALLSPVMGRIYPCTMNDYHVHGQKEVRIITTLEPVLNQHRLVLDKKAVEEDLERANKKLHMSGLYQLTHITKDRKSLKHDDMVDVLSAAAAYWQTSLSRNIEEVERQYKEKLKEEALRDFMDTIKGRNGNRSRVRRTTGGRTTTLLGRRR